MVRLSWLHPTWVVLPVFPQVPELFKIMTVRMIEINSSGRGGVRGRNLQSVMLGSGWQDAVFRQLGLALLAGAAVQAFPPAPYFSVYGDVRDAYGLLLPPGGSTVVVSQSGKEILREALTAVDGADYNYQIRLRMDMLRASTATYSSLTVNPGAAFTLTVKIGDQTYYPIEMATPPTVGKPSDRRRLNLTLGVDSDGDGLPDAWEESQLYQAGIQAGPNGWDLSLINRDGDLDKDGVSNGVEYIAGTYAGDATSTLDLQIKEKRAADTRLEFYAIYGKSYTLQASSDLKTWSALPFSLEDAAAATPPPAQPSYAATTTGVTSIHVPSPGSTTYYRLQIR